MIEIVFIISFEIQSHIVFLLVFLPHMGCTPQCNTTVYYYPGAMFKMFSHKTMASRVV